MKPGSLVEVINSFDVSFYERWDIKILPKKGDIYTIREIETIFGKIGVYFEEICIGYTHTNLEIGVSIDDVRELQIPPSIKEEIKESLTKELVLINN